MIREIFHPHFETLDGVLDCQGCDRPKAFHGDYCPDCDEFTPDYLIDAHPDQIFYGRASFTFDAAHELAPVVRLSAHSVIAGGE